MASIRMDRVSVSFPIYDAKSRSIKKRVLTAAGRGRIATGESNHVVIRALNGVSLNIEHGERVGLIGRNGAGKTTLLRVMAGIYEPPAGTVEVEGRVAPLFDIGMGMDPESSGYENILLRGLYLGLRKAEIRAKVDEIAEFTELGEFLEMPLRTYSAGMFARLAFAISTSIDPEILLLDEGIGAGDEAFLEKAKQRLDAMINRARIMVLASHSDELVRKLCNRAILMQNGEIVASGSTDEMLERYHGKASVPASSLAHAAGEPVS
ncbi:MAG: ABC transporter ATP-binding protein [Xanthobacteraceae bacterium]|jgi:ABC-type polysaccharide/polyol phosphate transport system ATPase subunit